MSKTPEVAAHLLLQKPLPFLIDVIAVCYVCFVLGDRDVLRSPDKPGTHNPLASTSPVLGSEVCISTYTHQHLLFLCAYYLLLFPPLPLDL